MDHGLRVDEDVIPERTADALVRIGTVEVVERVAAMLPGEEWYVRLYGIDVLGRIKRPESEAALASTSRRARSGSFSARVAALAASTAARSSQPTQYSAMAICEWAGAKPGSAAMAFSSSMVAAWHSSRRMSARPLV